MLEQAIVDANALRDVAIKTAESNLVEKYSEQIKEAVETLLEQPMPGEEDPMAPMTPGPMAMDPAAAGMAMPPPPMGNEGSPEDELDVPLGATEGEKLCPCPEEEKIVVVNLPELIKQAEEEAGEGVSPEEVEQFGTEVEPEEEEEEEEELPMGLEESIELPEEYLYDILESLKVDVSPYSVRDGWTGTPTAAIEEAEELELARQQSDEVAEDLEVLQTAVKELHETNEYYENMLLEAKSYIDARENDHQAKLNEAAGVLNETKKVAYILKNKLDEANLTNARLLYTNKVLSNSSLNGRQKNQIVEALINTESVEETKTIYETLQSAVGSTSKSTKRQPKSLSEVVNRTSTTMLPRLNEGQEKQDTSASNRWKILAGIKDN